MKSSGHRILRLSLNPAYAEAWEFKTPVGFPVLPEAGDPLRFSLLREWLQRCDKSHNNCKRRSSVKLPTRLLYIGEPKGLDYYPDFLKLVQAEEISGNKYIALSHCWGDLKKGEVPLYCTTPENVDKRKEGFNIADLPRTFWDAIRVARGLNVKYLWIDSLCIIQGERGDWTVESKTMEHVYTSAYCTIAAASADDSHAGFLTPRDMGEHVYIQDNLGRQVYVGTDIADFDDEIEKSRLNTRAWVMQERFLSCRTIHFGKSQMYWECGNGIYCEDLTQLRKEPYSVKDFQLDPNFPSLLFNSGFTTALHFVEDLLKDYSKRALSECTDRAIALSGLVARIAEALDCEEKYGIFGSYLYRNLLWQRSDQQSTMERIEYKSCDVPSWSWMAYTGGIDFMDLQFGKLDLFENLRFDQNNVQALITNVWKYQDCHLQEMEKAESEAARRKILDSRGTEKGWIVYDVDGKEDFLSQQAVVVGRIDPEDQSNSEDQSRYYILIVRQRRGMEGEYERVGVGMIQGGYILRQPADIRVF